MTGDVPSATIKINGKEYVTILDKHGTQRFPGNVILYDMSCEGKLDLNQIARRYGQDWHVDEAREAIREVYRQIRYSICGYAEIFPEDEIENPVWDQA